jgi:hypothetical protein
MFVAKAPSVVSPKPLAPGIIPKFMSSKLCKIHHMMWQHVQCVLGNLPLPGAEEREEARVRRRFSPAGASAMVESKYGEVG